MEHGRQAAEEREGKIDALIRAIEMSGVRELAHVMAHPKKLLLRSFLSGIFRGLGAAIGFSVLGAFALLVIKWAFGIDFS